MTEVDRRTVLRGAGAAGVAAAAVPLLSACGAGSGAGSAGPTSVTIPTSSVALHSGVIQDKVVVTQPSDGTFKAFSAICPHQGCTVATVADDVITCPCHSSTFSAADGAHISGPATSGLAPLTATVSGGNVVVT